MIYDGVFLFMCDCLWLRRFEKVTCFFPHDFASLQDMDDEILPFVPMTWMLSQWLGCRPRWGNIQNYRSCCTQCSNLKIWCRFTFRWHVQKGEEKTSQHIPKKKPGGHFFGPGDGNPRISLYVISKTSCITYVKLYLNDAVYIFYARTNRRNVICPVYESAFNVWS